MTRAGPAWAVLCLACLLVAQAAFGEGNVETGRALYAVCAGCHGWRGEGNVAVHAPKLTGLQAWYAARQLGHFQTGVRGADPRDAFGAQMAPMALTLWNPRALEDVVAYIGTLPATVPGETPLDGDRDRGRERYAPCSSCHGANGEGQEQLGAPQLADLDDWYLAAQVELFKAGQRGSHENDTYGKQMQPFAALLADDQALRDLAAYLATLRPPR